MFSAVFLIALAAAQGMSGSSARCTYHDYESYEPVASFENSPAWCGIRYSQLNLARITAVNGLGGDGCAKCLRVSGPAGSLYVLAVDTKADPGLDIARSSFAAITNENVLNPISCSWTVVADSYCAGICTGTSEECTPGRRNLLPAPYLVEKYGARPRAPQGLGGVTVSGGGGQAKEEPTTNQSTTDSTTSEIPNTTEATTESQDEYTPQDSNTSKSTSTTMTTTVYVTTTTKTTTTTTTEDATPTAIVGSREEVVYGTVSSSGTRAQFMFMFFITMFF